MSYKQKRWLVPLLLASALLAIYVDLLATQDRIFLSLPFWFWNPHVTPTNVIWLAVAGTALMLGVALVLKRMPIVWKLILLVTIGTLVQYSLAYSKGRGLDGIRDRMVNTGHAEFAEEASDIDNDDAWQLTRNYDRLAVSGELGVYAKTKPPGTLLIYVGFERLARVVFGRGHTPAERADRLRDLAARTWPVLTYLAIPLIYLLGRRFVDQTDAVAAGLLYATVPAVNLITLHTDETFYPLVALAFVCMFASAVIDRRDVLGLASGAVLYVAGYLSFGLLALGAFAAGFVAIVPLTWRDRLRSLSLLGCGFALTAVITASLLDYDMLARYQHATAYHQSWKGWDNSLNTLGRAALTNSVEYITWLGLPLAVLLVYAAVTELTKRRKVGDWSRALTLSLCLTFILILAFGKTKAETARLWLFLTPFVVIVASRALAEMTRHSQRLRGALLASWVALQFVATVAILKFQDFF